MSHDKSLDRIELQRYFSENSSISSSHAHQTNGESPNLTTSTNMSGTGSFGTGNSAPIPIVQHTDTDQTQNPTYSSIPDAHQQYRAAHAHLGPEHTPPPQAPPTSSTGHTPLLDNGETQYELIPGETKHGKALVAPLPAGVTMQADNVLYGDAETAQDLRHKTLTQEDYRHHYKGSISPQPDDILKEGEESRGGALRRCLIVGIAFVLLTLLIVALAAGVLSLAILFTGFIDTGFCDCPAESPTRGSTSSQIDDRIMMLEAQVQDLMARLDAAESTDGTTPSSDATTPPVMTMTPEPLPVDMERNVTLNGLDLFQDCNTSIEDRCTIDPGAPATGSDFLSCTTNIEGVTINRPGDYVLNVRCLIVEETVESNPLIATLDIDRNLALCRCYVPTLNLSDRVGNPVTCGLQITRCTIPTNITARIL